MYYFLKLLSFTILIGTLVTEVNAAESCLSQSKLNRLLSGKITTFNVVIGKKRASGRAHWQKSGVAITTTADGKKYRGKWYKVNSTRYCSRYGSRRLGKVCYKVRASC